MCLFVLLACLGVNMAVFHDLELLAEFDYEFSKLVEDGFLQLPPGTHLLYQHTRHCEQKTGNNEGHSKVITLKLNKHSNKPRTTKTVTTKQLVQ